MQIKRQLKTLENKTGSMIKKQLVDILCTHNDMKGCYFWSPPQNASGRRYYEQQRSNSLTFTLAGIEYDISQDCSCSCRNIYFSTTILVDGKKKDIRAIKKLL